MSIETGCEDCSACRGVCVCECTECREPKRRRMPHCHLRAMSSGEELAAVRAALDQAYAAKQAAEREIRRLTDLLMARVREAAP